MHVCATCGFTWKQKERCKAGLVRMESVSDVESISLKTFLSHDSEILPSAMEDNV